MSCIESCLTTGLNMASRCTSLRHQTPKAHLAFGVFALFVALGSTARSLQEPYPAQITPLAELPDLPSSLVVDQSVPVTEVADIKMESGPELRLRHRHLHKRQNDDEKDSGDKDDEESSTKEKADKTKTADDEKETKSSDDDDEDDKDKSSVAPTKTISEDLDDIATRSLSVAPSSSPTETEEVDKNAPLPIPFDGTATSEFVSTDGDDSCPNYISALLNSETFKDCYPLSMMIFVCLIPSG